jgi:thiol-disulfide isomerase/thioredoxin
MYYILIIKIAIMKTSFTNRYYLLFFCAAILYISSQAQSTAYRLVKDKNGNDMLWGVCSREALLQPPFSQWFVKNYDAYSVDSSLPATLKKEIPHKQYTVFFGTWCGDSQRELPRMLKLLDYLGVPAQQVKLVAVSNHPNAYKQSPGKEEKGLYIHRVPTLIVTKEEKEIGRIIEMPVQSLEKDLEKIISGSPYVPAYGDVKPIIDFIDTASTQRLQIHSWAALAAWKELVKYAYNLNSVAYLVSSLKEWDKAIAVYTITTQLFPGDVIAYLRLGEIYTTQYNREKAIFYYKRVLELEPANETAKKMLELEQY